MISVKSAKGFTLVESLIVLSIFLLLTLFTWLNGSAIHERKVIEQFFRQFQNDLYYAQQYAAVHRETVYVFVSQDDSYYRIDRAAFKGSLVQTSYNEDIVIRPTTMSLPITYYPNGSIKKGGTIFIDYKEETYKIVFTIGNGRFRVEKL